MKKLAVVFTATLCISFLSFSADSQAQSTEEAKAAIERANDNYIKWFNEGQIDSLMTLYREDACIDAIGCHKNYLTDYFKAQVGRYTFSKLHTNKLSIEEQSAREEGEFVLSFASGNKLLGTYSTEWQYADNRWQISRDEMNIVNKQ